LSAKDALRLEVASFSDPDHWRWRLTDARGKLLADHQVALDQAEAEYSAFVDLDSYLHQHSAPDKWPDDQVGLLRQVSRWIGERVLGPIGPAILRHGTPVTVRVIVPPEACGLLYRPLELARAGDHCLALQDVSLVFEVAGEAPPVRYQPVTDRLRILAVFSVPTDISALGLRRERYELERLVRRIAQTHDLAIELRVLQYGATRAALRAALEEGEGWDLMHFSGHGLPAGLVLEKADGTQDPIPADEVQKLVHRARGRLKLVTLSSCLSAAATVTETLRWMGIIRPAQAMAAAESQPRAEAVAPLPAVARALVRDLDCAVLAMRFAVGDDFAIALTEHLYEGMLGRGQSLSRALQLALPKALGKRPGPGVPPLSVATQALFGRRGVDLTLEAPSAKTSEFVPPAASLAFFPDEPERFVGRVGPLSRASAALAPKSSMTGVLFYGLAGGGKTACAVELAYRHRLGRFQGMVFYKAPDEGSDIGTALLDLAMAMEQQLPGFTMAHVVDRADEFARWLPRLTEMLEERSLLIVLDNLESLLAPDGAWRDERWAKLVTALLAHRGLSRIVLTSRRFPSSLGSSDRVLPEAIHALSLDEAALLARELPNLGRLLREESPVGLERGRGLVARTLAVVQGHPKLIEFAEGQAGEPEALARHLDRAAEAWAGGEGQLAPFFQQGESSLDAEQFLKALAGWTQALAAALPPASRTLFHFLCALEEGDRQSGILEANWADLWRRLGRPGEAPDLAQTMAPLTAAGLVEARAVGEEAWTYHLHPGVAEAGRAEAGDEFQAAADTELAAFWVAAFRHGRDKETEGLGGLVVEAGRRAAPYLLRRQDWEAASTLLEQAVGRDASPATIAGVLPLLRRIAGATKGTQRELTHAGVLAAALGEAGRLPEAEGMMRDIVGQAAARGDFRLASATAGDLIDLLRSTGRLHEALGLVEEKKGYTRQAGLGPWTQLADEARRLQVLNSLGRYDEVLSAVEKLRPRMRALLEQSDEKETVVPWNVRETVLNAGGHAAMSLERWQEALDLNAEAAASTEARGAPPLEVARSRFNDHGPLLVLRRYPEAQALLNYCRAVFQAEQDWPNLGKVFTALADLEDELGHGQQAIAFEETALRYKYLGGDPEDCAISHFNLANDLMRGGGPPAAALAHRLAAGVIRFQTGSGRLTSTLGGLALHFAEFAPKPPPLPASFDDLCRLVEEVEGVRFRELLERLPPRAGTGEEVLRQVVTLAQEAQRSQRPGRGRRGGKGKR